jgi:hypothetical protein
MDDERAAMLVKVMKPCSAQWKDIRFVFPSSALRQLAMSAFPHLERLALVTPGDMKGHPIIIRDVPLLRDAEIVHFPRPNVDLPLEQLTTLKLRASDTTQTIAVLQRCRNLVNLSCGSVIGALPPPLELHSLRSLKIADEHMLAWLTVPRLERLEISYVSTGIDAATAALQSLVLRSSCELQFLSVRLNLSTAAKFQRFLCAANTTRHLVFFFHYLPQVAQQIQALHGTEVLPRLKHLEIRNAAGGDYFPQLLDMLQWRQIHTGLESFELFLAPSVASAIPAAVTTEFLSLAEAGLQIRVWANDQGKFVDISKGSTITAKQNSVEPRGTGARTERLSRDRLFTRSQT